jgi:hypothetical protein
MTRVCSKRSNSLRLLKVSNLAQKLTISINRAPVLTLWAAVVAERLGFKRDAALTLGRAVAGLNAHAKGVSLGLFEPSSKAVDEHLKKAKAGATLKVDLLHRAVPVVRIGGWACATVIVRDCRSTPHSILAVTANKAYGCTDNLDGAPRAFHGSEA